MSRQGSITIEDLHEKTAEAVRRARRARSPVAVTDRGKLVAVLAGPHLLQVPRRGARKLLPAYAAFLTRQHAEGVLDDLDEVRGEH